LFQLVGELQVKVATVLGIAVCLIPVSNSLAQDIPIKIYITPTLIKKLDNVYLVSAMRAAFSKSPFSIETKPDDGTLVITEASSSISNQRNYTFTVAFFRDGSHLGDSVEGCEYTKVSDCVSQLIEDARSAAEMK
jgi:hypothetical protein